MQSADGYSTRPIEVFFELLAGHGVTQLIEVRTVLRSRHNPQFNEDALPVSLAAAANMAVRMQAALGGFRPTTDVVANLARVIELARTDRVPLMCAEAVPWRCHHSLISDETPAGTQSDAVCSRSGRGTMYPFAEP